MLNKIKTTLELKPVLDILRSAGKKIVFTNGCFDLIHTGHVRYLAKARSFGDILVVAVNSDASVRQLKGEKRPINSQDDRTEALAALASVDYVTVFDELDPHRIISQLQPDVLIKGGDWPVEKIIGRDVVEARGGKVISAGYIEGASTTGIIQRIVERYCEPVVEEKRAMPKKAARKNTPAKKAKRRKG
jgi:D-beta-D-heptose 7-phosphate kinase/D-beta-D-heptose 1-phosphate adenosyltransferase